MFKKKAEPERRFAGYPGVVKNEKDDQDSGSITRKMDAKGEAVAESLGSATIDNKYNSSM